MIDAFGDDRSMGVFLGELHGNPPPASQIRSIEWQPIPYESVGGFQVIASETSADRRVSIPPDLGICDACLREIFDPTDRRYLYPFTNCTNAESPAPMQIAFLRCAPQASTGSANERLSVTPLGT